MRNSYQNATMGAVDICHNEWASMVLCQGGKSKSSSAVAAVVSNTKVAAFQAYGGRYDFGRAGKRCRTEMKAGKEYISHRRLCVIPTPRLNAIL